MPDLAFQIKKTLSNIFDRKIRFPFFHMGAAGMQNLAGLGQGMGRGSKK